MFRQLPLFCLRFQECVGGRLDVFRFFVFFFASFGVQMAEYLRLGVVVVLGLVEFLVYVVLVELGKRAPLLVQAVHQDVVVLLP